MEAFSLPASALQERCDGTRLLVFLDELPWMDTPRSFFITALENFWNGWACHQPEVMPVVCGSANSWMLDKLVNNHGGLYGRLSFQIELAPLILGECEAFLESRGVSLSRYDIAQCYMIMGGIPYYLGCLRLNLSLAQNIDSLFFGKGAVLRDEFDRLFRSLFESPDRVRELVVFLARRSAGYTRNEIAHKLGISNGSTLSNLLSALLAGGFVVSYVPFGMSKPNVHYKLVDPFCLFFLRFVEGQSSLQEAFWMQNLASQAIVAWRGLAFENVCFLHIAQIKKALGISGVKSTQSAWTLSEGEGESCQIDLLVSRMDNIVNLCEIKFYNDLFSVDSQYYRLMMHRQNLLEPHLRKGMGIHNTLITTFGLAPGKYSSVFSDVVTLDNLFV